MEGSGEVTFRGSIGGQLAGNLAGTPPTPSFNANLFDSGLGKPQRTIVQDAVIDLLQRLLASKGGYLAAVEPTTTIVRGSSDEEGLALIFDQLHGRAPAILVATGDKDYQAAGDVSRWAASLNVHLYVLTNSLRSLVARAVGDSVSAADVTADPGSYVILEHTEQLLIGNHAGARGQIKELRPTAEHLVASDPKVELWEQRYAVKLVKAVNLDRDLDLELRTINTYHRLAEQGDSDDPIVTTNTDLEE